MVADLVWLPKEQTGKPHFKVSDFVKRDKVKSPKYKNSWGSFKPHQN